MTTTEVVITTCEVLFCWWSVLILARLAWTLTGRPMGAWDPRWFKAWLDFGVPWRPVYRVWMNVQRWYKQFLYGDKATAAWAGTLAMMTMTFDPANGIYLGRLFAFGFRWFQPIGLKAKLGALVVASAGAGKTTWLMSWIGMLPKAASAFIVDCDGVMVSVLGPALERAGHKVIRIDPYNLARQGKRGRWNLIAELDAAVRRHNDGEHNSREDVVRYAQTAADALVRENNSLQPVFSDNARAFVVGLLLFVWLFAPEGKRDLGYFRELLTCGLRSKVRNEREDPWHALLFEMTDCVHEDDGCGGAITAAIARAASIMRSGESKEGKNPFRGTAIEQTAWLDEPRAASVVQGEPNFTCEELKTGNTIVFFVAPVQDIRTKLSGLTRAMVMMIMYTFQNMPGERNPPCTLFIDELPSLGKTPLSEAPPTLRKYGLRTVCITQSMDMLESVYGPHDSQNFSDNAACTIWMSSPSPKTLQSLSNALSKRTQRETIEGAHWLSRLVGSAKTLPRYQNVDRPLLDCNQASEFLNPEMGRIIVTRNGAPALRVGHGAWYKELPIWLAEADPFHGETSLRAATRRLLMKDVNHPTRSNPALKS